MARKNHDILVGIIMGSKSDWPTMEVAALALEELGISYEAEVVSAHRTPDKMMKYAANAKKRGLRIIIAGAGGAARAWLHRARGGGREGGDADPGLRPAHRPEPVR